MHIFTFIQKIISKLIYKKYNPNIEMSNVMECSPPTIKFETTLNGGCALLEWDDGDTLELWKINGTEHYPNGPLLINNEDSCVWDMTGEYLGEIHPFGPVLRPNKVSEHISNGNLQMALDAARESSNIYDLTLVENAACAASASAIGIQDAAKRCIDIHNRDGSSE